MASVIPGVAPVLLYFLRNNFIATDWHKACISSYLAPLAFAFFYGDLVLLSTSQFELLCVNLKSNADMRVCVCVHLFCYVGEISACLETTCGLFGYF